MKLGFIGTGSMGKPMARNLLDAGHSLKVYNRTTEKAEPLRSAGAEVVSSPAAAATDVELVITMVSDDAALNTVTFGREGPAVEPGEGLIEKLGTDKIHLAMSTIAPDTSEKLVRAHEEQGQEYVAAPVFGKPDFAEAQTLSVVAAGPPAVVETCVPVFEAVGRQYFKVAAEPEKANIVKLAGNFTIAAMMETLGESFALMKKAGIEPEQFLEVINNSLYDSPLYENYGQTIANGDFEPAGFKLSLGIKDMNLAEATATDLETPMPLLNLVQQNFLSAVARGKGDIDWAGLGELAEERAGL